MLNTCTKTHSMLTEHDGKQAWVVFQGPPEKVGYLTCAISTNNKFSLENKEVETFRYVHATKLTMPL